MGFLLVVVDILLIKTCLGDLAGLIIGILLSIALNVIALEAHYQLNRPVVCRKHHRR